MAEQLRLVRVDRRWRLDAETRATGKRGVAQAREALRRASREKTSPGTRPTPAEAA